MIKVYANLVKNGYKKIEDVPKEIKEEVLKLLEGNKS